MSFGGRSRASKKQRTENSVIKRADLSQFGLIRNILSLVLQTKLYKVAVEDESNIEKLVHMIWYQQYVVNELNRFSIFNSSTFLTSH